MRPYTRFDYNSGQVQGLFILEGEIIFSAELDKHDINQIITSILTKITQDKTIINIFF